MREFFNTVSSTVMYAEFGITEALSWEYYMPQNSTAYHIVCAAQGEHLCHLLGGYFTNIHAVQSVGSRNTAEILQITLSSGAKRR